MKNIFYFKKISAIGGCETWFYYLSKLYKNMVIYYREGDSGQIRRLAKNVEVHKYKEGEIINCDNFFCCYGPDIINFVNAKNYCHVIHCDYRKVNFSPIVHPKFNKYIAVSKLAGESFKELTGIDYELIYNPVAIEIPNVKKYDDGKLHLISATRLSKEKGLVRMQKLAEMLDQRNIPYVWEVYTTRQRDFIGRNVIYKNPKIDIIEDIARSDYLVQLSDCEAFCYSVVESLMVGTPVIITDLPVFHEIGCQTQKNAFICEFSMKDIQLDQILKKDLNFTYKPPKSEWDRYLDNNSDYNPDELVKVRLRKTVYMIDEDMYGKRNHEYEIKKYRASELESKDLVEIL